MSKVPVKLLIIGAGSRGATYAEFAKIHPDRVQVVGVAEPRAHYRDSLAQQYDVPTEHIFTTWEDAAALPRFADAVIIATQDAMHAAPAIAFANLGYDILLEKPMATSLHDCQRIVDAVEKNDVLFAVCHILRYRNFTQQLKKIIAEGTLGEIVSIQHLEPVGYWHQAHSFVRGNWRNEQESAFMLLTKSCHDVDWISYIMDSKCESVASFGTLKHFRQEEMPEGAGERCLDCSVEPSCVYSAKKIYLGCVQRGETGWPVDILTPDTTEAGVTKALREGPYGRCVYRCDNDVVDNQVVIMQFAGGKTAAFTMTAFNDTMERKTRIFGTKGDLYADGSKVQIFDFMTDKITTFEIPDDSTEHLTGHGGGDYALMDHFIMALATRDRKFIFSGPQATLESHTIVFAAEQARKEKRVVTLDS